MTRAYDSFKCFFFSACKYGKNIRRNTKQSVTFTLSVIVIGSGFPLFNYFSLNIIPSSILLASDKREKKKIVILGTGWGAVNFLRCVLLRKLTNTIDS